MVGLCCCFICGDLGIGVACCLFIELCINLHPYLYWTWSKGSTNDHYSYICGILDSSQLLPPDCLGCATSPLNNNSSLYHTQSHMHTHTHTHTYTQRGSGRWYEGGVDDDMEGEWWMIWRDSGWWYGGGSGGWFGGGVVDDRVGSGW